MTTRPAPVKPTREQLEAINSSVHYAMFSAFALVTPVGDDDRDAIAQEVEALFAELTEGGVRIRGVYDVAGLRADAEAMTSTATHTAERSATVAGAAQGRPLADGVMQPS